MRVHALRRAAEGAPERRVVDVVDRGPRSAARGLLGLREPVHDGVAVVVQDDVEHAAAIALRAPERLDAVERRAVADDGDNGTARQSHPNARRRGQREPEAAHRCAEEAERSTRLPPLVVCVPAARTIVSPGSAESNACWRVGEEPGVTVIVRTPIPAIAGVV